MKGPICSSTANIFLSANLPTKSKEGLSQERERDEPRVRFDHMRECSHAKAHASKHAVISGVAKFSCDRSLSRSIGLVTRRAYDRRGQLGMEIREGTDGRGKRVRVKGKGGIV